MDLKWVDFAQLRTFLGKGLQIISLFQDIGCIQSQEVNANATNTLESTLDITSSCGSCCVLPGPGSSSTLRCHRLGRSSQSWGKIGYDKNTKIDLFPVPFRANRVKMLSLDSKVCLHLVLSTIAGADVLMVTEAILALGVRLVVIIMPIVTQMMQGIDRQFN